MPLKSNEFSFKDLESFQRLRVIIIRAAAGAKIRNRSWRGHAPPNMEFFGGHAPQEKLLGGGQTQFSKISLYLVLRGRKIFGAFGAAKTLQLFIILPFLYIFEWYDAYKTRILAKLLKIKSFSPKIHHCAFDLWIQQLT